METATRCRGQIRLTVPKKLRMAFRFICRLELFVGAFIIRALQFGVYIKAPDFGKGPGAQVDFVA